MITADPYRLPTEKTKNSEKTAGISGLTEYGKKSLSLAF